MKSLAVIKSTLYAVLLTACSFTTSHALSTSAKRLGSGFDPVVYMPKFAALAPSQNAPQNAPPMPAPSAADAEESQDPSVPGGLKPVDYDIIDDVPRLPQDLPDPPPPPPVPPPKPPSPPVPPAEGERVGPLPALMLLPHLGGVPAAETPAIHSLFEDYPVEPPSAPLVAVERPPTMARRQPAVRGVPAALLVAADPQQMVFPILPPLPRNAL